MKTYRHNEIKRLINRGDSIRIINHPPQSSRSDHDHISHQIHKPVQFGRDLSWLDVSRSPPLYEQVPPRGPPTNSFRIRTALLMHSNWEFLHELVPNSIASEFVSNPNCMVDAFRSRIHSRKSFRIRTALLMHSNWELIG